MLTFCSFLQSIYQSAKKVYRKSAIMILGAVVVTAMIVAEGIFGGSEKNAFIVHAETPQSTEEIALLTEAKIQFQLTGLSYREEGQILVGETLVQEIQEQETLREGIKDAIDKAWEETEQLEAERVKAAEEAARVAEEERLQQAAEAEAEAAQASAVIQYSEQDYEVLTRIVQAESGGCDIKGRILIANVIFNRVKDDEFPDTITEVVYQKSQFSPVMDGSLKKCKVTQETIDAVDRALAGEDYSQGALYFMNRKLSSSRNVAWFDRNLTYLFQYDRHEFFK